jgi:hypothetical protein
MAGPLGEVGIRYWVVQSRGVGVEGGGIKDEYQEYFLGVKAVGA